MAQSRHTWWGLRALASTVVSLTLAAPVAATGGSGEPPAADGPSRDIVFALDASGSMREGKFDAVKVAFREMTQALRDGDRFTVFAFSAPPDWWTNVWREQLEPATDAAREDAQGFVAGSGTSGSSNLLSALQVALGFLPAEPVGEPIVVLVTDGHANSGPVSNDNVLRAFEKANARNACIFTVAVGEDANRPLLASIAAAHDGQEVEIEGAGAAVGRSACELPRPARAPVELARPAQGAVAQDAPPADRGAHLVVETVAAPVVVPGPKPNLALLLVSAAATAVVALWGAFAMRQGWRLAGD